MGNGSSKQALPNAYTKHSRRGVPGGAGQQQKLTAAASLGLQPVKDRACVVHSCVIRRRYGSTAAHRAGAVANAGTTVNQVRHVWQCCTARFKAMPAACSQ